MNTFAHKLIAAAAAASVSMAASPAFALSVDLEGSAGAQVSSERASDDASMKTDVHGTRRGWRFGTFLRHKTEVEHEQQPTIEQIEGRFDAMIKRSVRVMANVAKRACMNESADSVSSCVAGIAAHVKASFSAAVDAAFTVEASSN